MARRYRKRRYARRIRRMRYKRARRSSRRILRIARRAVAKMSETKAVTFSHENVQLYHNLGPTGGAVVVGGQPWSDAIFFNCWANIVQGATKVNRIGNRIMPRGMAMRLWLANKQDRPNIIYRVIIAVVPKLNQAGQLTTPTNLDTFELPLTSNLIRTVDHDLGIKVLYDRLVRNEKGCSVVPNPGLAGDLDGKESHVLKKIWIKRRGRPIIFNDATNVIVNKPIALYVIPYDSYGTLTTDNIASYSYFCKLFWKDI